MRFADDSVIISEDFEEFKTMMAELQKCSAEAGLEMSPPKTKILSEDYTRQLIEIGKEKIECLSEIIYLGQLIYLNSGPSK